MIIQLPNGRIIECSLEQYLSLTDEEYKDLNGLSSAYTKDVGDPFYASFSKRTPLKELVKDDFVQENEPALDEIDAFEKMDDPYFHSDDI
jgi:hypothetical protein